MPQKGTNVTKAEPFGSTFCDFCFVAQPTRFAGQDLGSDSDSASGWASVHQGSGSVPELVLVSGFHLGSGSPRDSDSEPARDSESDSPLDLATEFGPALRLDLRHPFLLPLVSLS
jgi:hypothetical protein